MSCTVLSAGGTKICKADTSHWMRQAGVGLALQEYRRKRKKCFLYSV